MKLAGLEKQVPLVRLVQLDPVDWKVRLGLRDRLANLVQPGHVDRLDSLAMLVVPVTPGPLVNQAVAGFPAHLVQRD